MNHFERIMWNDEPLAHIIRADINPDTTTFLTPPEFNLQVGFIAYPTNGKIAPHFHLPLERHIVGTTEVLVVKRGRCEIDIYNEDKKLVATRQLKTGDVILIIGGGHGFRMLEDTVILEIKQGPYTGLNEKERF